MTHLTPDEMIDVVEGQIAPACGAHLRSCQQCHSEVSQLSAVLHEARAVDAVPEPSPLFWDQLTDRVRTAIAAETETPGFARWFEWPVLAPLAGLAVLVFALVSTLAPETLTTGPEQVAEHRIGLTDEARMAGIDESWDVVSELVGDLDVDTAWEAGIAIEPGSAEGIVAQLTAAEQQELVRLLQAELHRAGG
jgi:hypothetical protein